MNFIYQVHDFLQKSKAVTIGKETPAVNCKAFLQISFKLITLLKLIRIGFQVTLHVQFSTIWESGTIIKGHTMQNCFVLFFPNTCRNFKLCRYFGLF